MRPVLLLVILIAPFVHAQEKQIEHKERVAERRKQIEDEKRARELAVEKARQAVIANPDSAEDHFILGDSMLKVTFTDQTLLEAVKEFQRAITLKPDYAEAYFGLARTYGMLGRDKEKVEALDRTIALNPNLAEAHSFSGFLRVLEKKYVDARKVPITPEEAQLAVEDFKRAIQIKPDLWDAYTGLGLAYLYLKRLDEAVDAFKQAIHFKPSDVIAHQLLAAAYIELGDKSAAMEQHDALISLASELDIDLEAAGRSPDLNLARAYGEHLLREIEKRFGKQQ